MKKLKIILILLSILGPALTFANDSDMVKLRGLYYKAASNKEDAVSFYNYLKNNPGINSGVFSAYSGMSYMIRANYAFNPYNKLSFFIKGKDKLETSIENNPHVVELRFLRYCIQTNAPAFLGYNSKIKEDKTYLLIGYPLLKDDDLKNRIKEYMASSKYCTEEEKKTFK